MLLCKFKVGEESFFGIAEGDIIKAISGSFFDKELIVTNRSYNSNQIRLLPPCRPSKIVAVGLNYTDHAHELKMDLPKEPLIFIKPSTAVIGHGESIVYPKGVERLDYEAELGIVIKKRAKGVTIGAAKDYILGYTCLNDVTARDIQKRDGQWTRAKSFDTFCPIGPFIAKDIDVRNLDIQLFLNNELKQSSNTKNMIFAPENLVSFISNICTLLPGDVIATGTPSGVGPMKPKDKVEVRIENIGSLINRVEEKRP